MNIFINQITSTNTNILIIGFYISEIWGNNQLLCKLNRQFFCLIKIIVKIFLYFYILFYLKAIVNFFKKK